MSLKRTREPKLVHEFMLLLDSCYLLEANKGVHVMSCHEFSDSYEIVLGVYVPGTIEANYYRVVDVMTFAKAYAAINDILKGASNE